ncbi:MAG: ATP-dependent zinc metalloprotease FtsH [Clostridia bacterium]|nr:ATP-dependent zinc metalloprotease FtsH [Clostridia bacterium]
MFFIISLVAIIFLIYLTQGASIGTKIIISGSSVNGNGTIEELIGIPSGETENRYSQESLIKYIVISDSGTGYVLRTDSENTVANITKSSDYYFNFVSEQELEKLQFYIDDYNAFARTHNALEVNANDQWVIISQESVHVGTSWWENLLPYISIIIIVGIGFILIKSILGANSKSFNFGKTKAQIAHNVKIKFTDVAGIDEEKEELQEIVEFLKNPQKFSELGAKIPKGILLVGLPGTGKTLLAKAIAGESSVPFFSISGSDFVEMFVGVGASRVRDLFDQAKKESPCIVFIDEIDAVGRQRGAGLGGGNDEREQTLNQLLVQMDGFEDNTGIIVIAATNRSDVLDPALLRPGRFDRQIFINPPDVKGREMILKIHARNKPIDSSVDFKNLARLTSGFTGADIENLLNESAILAARENRKIITMTDITESINKVLMGPQKRSRIITDSDKRITACHESGHAIIGKVLEHCDVVQEVSIIPRGMAAGYTISRPDNDESHMSYNKLMATITQLLGGRASEEILIKDISTGAQNDIERATKIARKMVMEWGMSVKLGPLNFASNSEVFIGRDYQTHVTYSENTASEIDKEVKMIIDKCFEDAKNIIKIHLKEIDTMIDVLLEKETIYYNEIELIMKGKTSKQVISQMEKEEVRNKAKIEIERAEAELEKTRKEQNIRIKTAEALKNGGVLSQEEIQKVKEDSVKVITQAEEKVEELKKEKTINKISKKTSKKVKKTDELITPTKETLKEKEKSLKTNDNDESKK